MRFRFWCQPQLSKLESTCQCNRHDDRKCRTIRSGAASSVKGTCGTWKISVLLYLHECLKSKETKERLDILNHSNDGFKIASEDLRLRRSGDLFGIRQSGLMNFKLGDIYQDAKILQMANEAADQLTEEDEEWIRKLPNYENAAGVVI